MFLKNVVLFIKILTCLQLSRPSVKLVLDIFLKNKTIVQFLLVDSFFIILYTHPLKIN